MDIAAEMMEETYKGPTPPKFVAGERVFLEAKNLKERIQENDVPTRLMVKKLRKKRIGPYRIIKSIGEVNYRLDISPEMREKGVHDVFHVALLTKAPEDKIPGRMPEKPIPIEIDEQEEW